MICVHVEVEKNIKNVVGNKVFINCIFLEIEILYKKYKFYILGNI